MNQDAPESGRAGFKVRRHNRVERPALCAHGNARPLMRGGRQFLAADEAFDQELQPE
jgi:hypothetical protein